MSNNAIGGLPGVGNTRTHTPRTVRRNADGLRYVVGHSIIGDCRDPGNTGDINVLRPGLLMGRESAATKKFLPSIIGVSTAAIIATATEIVVSAAQATEIVRRNGATGNVVITGPEVIDTAPVNQETLAYSAINTTTGAITIAATTYAYVEGSSVGVDDGSADPVALVDDNDFIKVTDADENSQDQNFPRPLIGGYLDSDQIIDLPADVVMKADVVSKLNASGQGDFLFSHLVEE